MFRPDGNGAPRWVGNLKQYQFGLIDGTLDLVDKRQSGSRCPAPASFHATAESFWSEGQRVLRPMPSGTPASASDLPDGAIVEKGGAAQQLRKDNLQGAIDAQREDAVRAARWCPSDQSQRIYGRGGRVDPRREQRHHGQPATEHSMGRTATAARHLLGDDRRAPQHPRRRAALAPGGAELRRRRRGGLLRRERWILPRRRRQQDRHHGGAGNVVVHRARTLWLAQAPARRQRRLCTFPKPTARAPPRHRSVASEAKSYGMDGPIVRTMPVRQRRHVLDGGDDLSRRCAAAATASMHSMSRSRRRRLFMWRITGGSGDYAQAGADMVDAQAGCLQRPPATAPLVLIMGGGYDADEDKNLEKASTAGSAMWSTSSTGSLARVWQR